jgi:predicted enzyme related to lactoylglutathione lyase
VSGALGLGGPAYLYVGVDDVTRAVDFYEAALGAQFVWRFARFGTEVAAVRLSDDGPLVLLAGHRPVPSCLPIWTVDDLEAAVTRLEASGFDTHGETVGTPDGPVHVLRDPSGNEIGLLRADNPGALEAAYADPTNTNAVRES